MDKDSWHGGGEQEKILLYDLSWVMQLHEAPQQIMFKQAPKGLGFVMSCSHNHGSMGASLCITPCSEIVFPFLVWYAPVPWVDHLVPSALSHIQSLCVCLYAVEIFTIFLFCYRYYIQVGDAYSSFRDYQVSAYNSLWCFFHTVFRIALCWSATVIPCLMLLDVCFFLSRMSWSTLAFSHHLSSLAFVTCFCCTGCS